MIIQYSSDTDKQDEKKNIEMGNFTNLQNWVKEEYNKGEGRRAQDFVISAIDAAARNPVWRDGFQKAFNRTLKTKANFSAFSDEEREAMRKYTITGGVAGTDLSGILETTILPVVDGLTFDANPILSQLTQIPVGLNDGNQSFELNQFSAEVDAESLDEDDAGTEADDKPRDGDTLTPKNKVQRSTSITEYALLTLNNVLLGQLFGKLVRSVQNRYVQQIFKGTNASNQFKGIINSNGSGEDDQQGALTFTDNAAADTVDLMLRSLGDLPNNVTNGEESQFVFYMTRQTFYQKVAVVTDLNKNYKLSGVINDMPGQRSVGGIPVMFVGDYLSSGQVVLADLANYLVARKGGLRLLNDEAKSNIKAGTVTFVAREYADGGMIMAHKNKIGSGAGANDNQARNMFRTFTLT